MPGRRNSEDHGDQKIGLAVQLLATILAAAMAFGKAFLQIDINDLFIWAMFGLAYKARPETIWGMRK